ncbi:hypothetical protein DFH28DRAFT_881075 [Melampsora americana]|nr:hypothetical protein DFH28DRAFT_881075 [Melampsora americana]
MGIKITPKKNYQRTNLTRRPDLITPNTSARRALEFCYLDMPVTALPEVKRGEDQCYTCLMFGHVWSDCPRKWCKPVEDFANWRLIENSRVYSLLALYPPSK